MNRFLAFCLLVIVLVGVLAFALHWLNVSKEVKPDGSTGVAVTVDRNKFNHDMGAVKHAAKDVEEGVKSGAARLANTSSVTGVVTKVDPAGHHVTVTNQDKTVDVNVTDQTKIHVGDKDAHLSDLTIGEMAKVSYITDDKDHTAKSIEVVEKH